MTDTEVHHFATQGEEVQPPTAVSPEARPARGASPVRIAVVDPLGAHGGHHYYVNDQAQALWECGADVTVFNSRKSRRMEAGFAHAAAFDRAYEGSNKALKGLRMAGGIVRSLLRARLRGCNVCITHLFKHDWFEFLQVRLARLLGMRTVCIVHDVERIDDSRGDGFVHAIHAVSDLIVVHNEFSRATLARNIAGGHDMAVVPHGNYIQQYPERMTMDAARAALGLATERFVFLFFGNPREAKGLHLAIEALAQLDHPDLLLLVAGKMKAEGERRFREMAERLGVTGRVRFDVQHIDDADLPAYFAAADLVVLPYTKVYESGVSIMAMSLARPVLVSDLEPLVEATRGGLHGRLFRAGDAADLARAIAAARDERDALPALGEGAFEYVRTERSWAEAGKTLYGRIEPLVVRGSG